MKERKINGRKIKIDRYSTLRKRERVEAERESERKRRK
jgi:hypothetical protein